MKTDDTMKWCCSLLLAGLFTTSSWAVLTPVDDVPVRTPANYDPMVPSPLVIALHGYTGNGNETNGLLGLWPEAEDRGFLYASPTGSTDLWGSNYWNATDACCDFLGENIDHVGYLMDLVASIQSRYNVGLIAYPFHRALQWRIHVPCVGMRAARCDRVGHIHCRCCLE